MRRHWLERLARAAARRPRLTMALWGVVVAASIVAVIFGFGNLTANDSFLNNPESKRADALIAERMPGALGDSEVVVVRSSGLTVDDAAMKAEIQALQKGIMAIGPQDVLLAITYYDVAEAAQRDGGDPTAAELLVSQDRDTTIIPITLAAGTDTADQHIAPLYDLVHETGERLASQGYTIALTGNATWEHEAQPLASNDLKRGELIGMPIALVVLVLVFGTLVAAGVPFVLAFASIIAALAAIALLAGAFELSLFAANVVTMMGLAVGIDYSLFILSRFREERSAGLSVIDAIGRAAATASRAVLVSGITVVLALVGMLMIPFSIFLSMGIGMILVVVFAVASALTLLPALLALLGDRVNALPIPFRGRKRQAVGQGGWSRSARWLMRRPALTLLVGAGVLIALLVPSLDLTTGEGGASEMPPDSGVRLGYEMLAEDFSPGLTSPLLVVIDGDQNDVAVQGMVAALGSELQTDDRFQLMGYETSAGGDLGVLTLAPTAEATEVSGQLDAVSDLRDRIIPAAVQGAPVTVLVGGGPAALADMQSIVDRMTPVVFAVVLTLSFLLLLVVFRAPVVAAIAVVMNLLSVGAAYGLLTLVFQHGVGATIFGFQQTPQVTTWVPLLLFCVLFGLSMDYQVFLLSRIRERYEQTGDTREAVVFGVSSTAGIITGAALIMVAVFGGMASGDLVMFQQIGFGLAVAIALDATVVRTLVMPATMALLGKYNWYLPRWLRRLPKVEVEGGEPAWSLPPEREGA